MKIFDKAKPVILPGMEVEKVRGVTKIELYNPNTRIKKVYRDENTFQSAKVAAYMRSLGMVGQRLCDPTDGNTDSGYGYSWKNILGGLFLFRDQITEGTEFMPAGNKMVGNGAYMITNAGSPSELGSFNELESSASVSAITQVYDFNTAQANGDINCMCLSSQVGAHIGYGNTSGGVFDTKRSFFNGKNSQGLGSGQALRNNYRYTFSFDRPILTITKTYVPITQCSIKANINDTWTIDLTDYGMSAGQNINSLCQDGQYLYFVDSNRGKAASGGTFTYYKFDLDTDTLTTATFTNSSSVALDGWYGFSVAHGLAFVNGTGGIFVFDLSNSTLVKENAGGLGYRYAGGLIIMNIGNAPYFYDTANDTILPTNGVFSLSHNAGYNYFYDDTTDIIYDRQYNDGIVASTNPLYLATINNLDNTVQKTAAQTMKVTYTLTEV